MAAPTNRNLDQIPGWHGWRPFVGCRGHRVFCASGSANLSRSHAKSTWTNLRHTLLRCSFVALVTTSTCRSCPPDMLRESSFNLLQVRRWDLRFLEILPQQSQSSSVDLLCGVVDQVSLQPWHLSSGMLTMNTMTLPTLMQQNYTKRTWRLRACEFPRRNSSAVLRAGERCSTCKGLKKGRTCFIFALFSTLGLMIILILETMTISPKRKTVHRMSYPMIDQILSLETKTST